MYIYARICCRYATRNGEVELRCNHNVEPEQLHKVEWLKGGTKIFQYVKGRTPPFRNYSTLGATLDVSTVFHFPKLFPLESLTNISVLYIEI